MHSPRSADYPETVTYASTQVDAWAPTRAQTGLATEIMHREDGDAVTGERPDIGRLVGNGDRELFVSCGPVEAMEQQFDVLQPEFIVLHDIGCAVSRKLLASVASASNRTLQKLVIRRQGFGTPLASIDYLEWGSSSGMTIRLYTTEIEAEPAARTSLALLLLARSRLGVVIVGDGAGALPQALAPLRDAMQSAQWHNRDLLMLPLSAPGALAQQAAQFADRGLSVRTTPQVQRPADAWSYLSGSWNRMREQLGPTGQRLPLLAGVSGNAPMQAARPRTESPPIGELPQPPARPAVPTTDPRQTPPAQAFVPPVGAARPQPSAAPTVTLPSIANVPMRPMPTVPTDGPRAPMLDDQLADYVGRVVRIAGMHASCVIDLVSQQVLAKAGTRHDHAALARQALGLMKAVREAATGLGTGVGEPELALTLSGMHLLMRTIPTHPTLMLVTALDKATGNLTLARLQIQRMDEEFDPVAL